MSLFYVCHTLLFSTGSKRENIEKPSPESVSEDRYCLLIVNKELFSDPKYHDVLIHTWLPLYKGGLLIQYS